MIGFIDYGAKATFTGALVLGSFCLPAHFYKSTSASESYFLHFYMRPPFQISSVRPVTVLRSALAPSPRRRPPLLYSFHIPTAVWAPDIKGTSRISAAPLMRFAKIRGPFLWVPRYEVIALAAHLAGPRRQSKFTGAATGATAGAAACAEALLGEFVRGRFPFIWLGFADTPNKQGSFVCSASDSTGTRCSGGPVGGAFARPRPHARRRVYPT